MVCITHTYVYAKFIEQKLFFCNLITFYLLHFFPEISCSCFEPDVWFSMNLFLFSIILQFLSVIVFFVKLEVLLCKLKLIAVSLSLLVN